MGKFKKNIVRPNIFDYNIAIIGQQGAGKSTLAYKVCKKLLGNRYVIFNCGKEDGIKALPDAIFYDCPDWDTLDEIIDDIVDNPTSDDYKDLKVVVLDTIDEIFNMAEKKVIALSNSKNPAKRVTTINEAFSGFGAGLKKTEELVLDALWRLKSVGINIFVIGHTKTKTMIDPINDGEYDILTSNLSNRYFTEIATKMDVIGVCYIDRDIITEKTNRKDIRGKIVEKNVVANEARKICFRSDNYVTASKSRFPDIEGVINLDADEFIRAIEDAIQKLIDKSSMSEDEIREYSDKRAKELEARVAAKEQETKSQKALDDIIDNIVTYMAENKTNLDIIKPILEACKNEGFANPKQIDNVDVANKILNMCK